MFLNHAKRQNSFYKLPLRKRAPRQPMMYSR